MKKYKYYHIFVPGGMPENTYNPREELGLEGKLKSISNSSKLTVITGLTKSGKTVLVNKMYPRDNAIWFDGGAYSNEEEFWGNIADQLEVSTTITKSKGNTTKTGLKGIIKGQIGFPFITGVGGAAETSIDKTKAESTGGSRTVSSKASAIKVLRATKKTVVIDDFHYIPREDQGVLVRAFKSLVFDGVPIILIAIPHRRYDSVKVEREMTGRIEHLEVPAWSMDELKKIPSEGFPLLNVSIKDNIQEKLARESFGSPHLMQEFSRRLCEVNLIEETLDTLTDINLIDEKRLFEYVAENSCRHIFEKLKKGPRQRKDRIQRKLKNGHTVDIYGVVLYALVHIRPGIETLEYEIVRSAIRDIIDDKLPQSWEISRVLSEMAKISLNDESSTPVIDWEKDEKLLHITDPFFAFFLKWANFDEAQIG